jgi:hypothetical protein
LHFYDKFRRSDLVGIKEKDPLIATAAVVESPIALSAKRLEVMCMQSRSGFLRKTARIVRAARIQNVNIIAPNESRETNWQILRFVFRKDDNADHAELLLRILLLHQFLHNYASRLDRLARMSSADRPFGHVMSDDGACADYRAFADCYAWQHHAFRGKPHLGSNHNWFR